MGIKTMDKETVKFISARVQQSMEELAAELCLEMNYKGGTYDPTAGTFLVKCQFELAEAEQNTFERDVQRLSYTDAWLTKDDYRREFDSQGKTFVITGINLRAPKFPIKALCLDDNRHYKFPESTVKRALGRV